MEYRLNYKLFFFLFLFSASLYVDAKSTKKNFYDRIKVLLCEWSNLKPVSLTSGKGFRLIRAKKPVKEIPADITIRYIHDRLVIDSFFVDEALLVPKDGTATLNGNTYNGSFLITKHRSKAHLINIVDLEEYISSVLRTESWPGWPREVNKVFAIASRSYAMAMIKRTRKSNLPYDVKSTNAHQTYRGVHSCQTIKDAVEQTKGTCLLHKDEPILAMFDGCCGGVIPSKIEHFDFSTLPYLARPYACTYCKRCKIYQWKAEYDFEEFEKRVAMHIKPVRKVHEVKIAECDAAGLVNSVYLRGHSCACHLSGQKLYSLFKEFKSFCFEFEKKDNKLLVQGTGYGHHLGLCQWGAREMVRDGWSYKRILQFYYPKTKLMKLA